MQLQSDKIEELMGALVKAQGEIRSAEEDSMNPHFKSKYASYEAIRRACKQPLLKNGLVLTHQLLEENGKRVMVTQITHLSGQWIRSCLSLPQSDKETPQQIGSAISYAKRYTLSPLLAICTGEDDDGEAAEQPYREGGDPREALRDTTITIAQSLEIERLVGEDKELMSRILNGYQVEKLTDIKASAYPTIVKHLKAREK